MLWIPITIIGILFLGLALAPFIRSSQISEEERKAGRPQE